jgi:hypothetical protein
MKKRSPKAKVKEKPVVKWQNNPDYRITRPMKTDEGWINCDGSLFADADRLENAAIMAGEGVRREG